MYIRLHYVCMHVHVHTCTFIDFSTIVKPRRACAARVIAVGSICLSVRLSVKSHVTSGAKVKKFVWFSLKTLRCRDTALPALYGYP